MKVKHLIKELQKVSPEAEVFLECQHDEGNCFSVRKDSSDSIIIQSSMQISYDNNEDTPEPMEVKE